MTHVETTTLEKLHSALRKQGETLVTAESCTGGMIAARITDRAGSSRYFLGGVVVYSNALKTDLLGVSSELLEKHGAVSKQVAKAMAEGARAHLGGDWAVAVTGVAGPGRSEKKPAGLVYIAVAGPEGDAKVKKNNFRGGRESVRVQTMEAALEFLWEQIAKRKA